MVLHFETKWEIFGFTKNLQFPSPTPNKGDTFYPELPQEGNDY